jgi:acyl-CoA reductase-like NAD-dependent aldehyde dehydrogenase
MFATLRRLQAGVVQRGFDGAVEFRNSPPSALTTAIWPASVHHGHAFVQRIRSCCARQQPTYGSEPHRPFGGLGGSDTGGREPRTEPLDVYSALKTVHVPQEIARVCGR